MTFLYPTLSGPEMVKACGLPSPPHDGDPTAEVGSPGAIPIYIDGEWALACSRKATVQTLLATSSAS